MKMAHSETTPPAFESGLTLDISGYAWVGFDMDHTFAQYKLDAVSRLIYRGTRDYLKEMHGYAALEALEYDATFATKGCIFDVARGNIINLTSSGRVCCARHGRGPPLSEAQLDAVYGSERQVEFWDDIRNFRRDLDRFLFFNSAFVIPSAQILATLVDSVDQQAAATASSAAAAGGSAAAADGSAAAYATLLRQLFGALNHMFEPSALPERRGTFFPGLSDAPEAYLEPVSDAVLRLLSKCRERGQKLLLMTNSRADFTEVVMRAVAGPEWRGLFDLVVASATKPAFFAAEAPFEPAQLALGGEFVGGNWKALRDQLGIGAAPSSVLYFGDDINGDVAALANTNGAWEGVAVVEELHEDAHDVHVFHCPKAPQDAFETMWFDSIEREAVLCVPSVQRFAESVGDDGVLQGCHRNRVDGPTLWFPRTPLEALQATAPAKI